MIGERGPRAVNGDNVVRGRFPARRSAVRLAWAGLILLYRAAVVAIAAIEAARLAGF